MNVIDNLYQQAKGYSIFLLYVVISIQGVAIMDFGGAALKPYHVLVAAWFVCVALSVFRHKKEIPFLGWPFCAYVVSVIGLSLLDYFYIGFNPMIANYLFAFALFWIVRITYDSFSYSDALAQLRMAAWVVGLLILFDAVISHGGDRSNRIDLVFSVYGGGINLEATWVALACCFFMRKNGEFILYLLVSIAIDYFTLSRAASLITAVVFFYWLLVNRDKVKKQYVLLLLFAFVAYFVYLFLGGEVGRPLLDRFSQIGSAGGGNGRERLLHYAALVFWDRPYIGWGAGNAILALKSQGFGGPENNVHNYIIQNFLDFGVVGLVFWLLFFASLFVNSSRKPELRCYLICFFVAGMVQFRGAEPIFYFVVPLLISAVLGGEKNGSK